jgi:hypothetical protein
MRARMHATKAQVLACMLGSRMALWARDNLRLERPAKELASDWAGWAVAGRIKQRIADNGHK